VNLRSIIQRDRLHEQRAADVARDERRPREVDQRAVDTASDARAIQSLRQHIAGLQHMLDQAARRLDQLERQAR
jgi:hypothetical protein